MNIENDLVQVSENDEILHRKLFDVNMRLYTTNTQYKSVILACIDHMKKIIDSTYDNYNQLKGLSGANVGIPYNIVLLKHITFSSCQNIIVLINPKISRHSTECGTAFSNCGSIQLKQKIPVQRFKNVSVEYYTIEGQSFIQYFVPPMSYTIQHEIEHNCGILITDKMETI